MTVRLKVACFFLVVVTAFLLLQFISEEDDAVTGRPSVLERFLASSFKRIGVRPRWAIEVDVQEQFWTFKKRMNISWLIEFSSDGSMSPDLPEVGANHETAPIVHRSDRHLCGRAVPMVGVCRGCSRGEGGAGSPWHDGGRGRDDPRQIHE